MTLSVLAWDPERGAGGYAVATSALAVGALCPAWRAQVGAVVVHGYVTPLLGARILDLLALDVPPEDALRLPLTGDAQRELRQIHLVDSLGTTAAFTGAETGPWAGHSLHKGFSVAGTTLVGPEVLDAMIVAYTQTHVALPLPDRLLATLEAGDAAGGDRRGRQSAALCIAASPESFPVDLRVDDHPHPVAELRRIYNLAVTSHLPLRRLLEHLDAG